MTDARMHDGTSIELVASGSGPVVLLPVNPVPSEGVEAEEKRNWGVDPALGKTMIDDLSVSFRVVAFDYESHVMACPKADTLTPDNVATDLLAVADAAQAETFAYYGYSWLALVGLQLAIRTDRLSALVMGGYPPIGGPYSEMLQVTTATHDMASSTSALNVSPGPTRQVGEEFDWDAVQVTLSEPQTRQFVTLYQALQGFDDREAQHRITCPRLCFAGTADTISYGERWGGVTVDIAGAFASGHDELVATGWDVRLLDGLDHTQAMQPVNVLPLLHPWLARSVAA